MKVAGAKPQPQAVDTPLFIRLGEMELTPISWLIKGILEADTVSAIVGLQVRVNHLWLSIWRSALHQAKTTMASR